MWFDVCHNSVVIALNTSVCFSLYLPSGISIMHVIPFQDGHSGRIIIPATSEVEAGGS
jgi:hypothetical protein